MMSMSRDAYCEPDTRSDRISYYSTVGPRMLLVHLTGRASGQTAFHLHRCAPGRFVP
jgi:hypothetical protein